MHTADEVFEYIERKAQIEALKQAYYVLFSDIEISDIEKTADGENALEAVFKKRLLKMILKLEDGKHL